jgi:mannitol/fructose-specific phosphotransferase system IIA component (Ntr-type)
VLNIEQYLAEDLVCLDLKAHTHRELFKEMLHSLEQKGYIAQPDQVEKLLLKRERLSSTGIKGGFAIPHAYLDQIQRSQLVVGLSKRGVDFQTEDREPVHVIFLLLGPTSERGLHVRLLACLSRIVSSENLCENLLQATSAEQVIALLKQTPVNCQP